jgi:membrane protein DedA with SNARE-associated domain
MIEHSLPPQIQHLLSDHGDIGMFAAMFLESSIIPIPSELVIAAAGAIGLPLLSIVIFGALGSTLGGMVGYAIGRFAGLPFILRFGKYILITPDKVRKAEAFAQKYGVWSVLIGRVLPVIPFKVFSIAAGMMELPFLPFVGCTLLGVVPRLVLLALFGAAMVKFTKITLIIVAVGALAYFGYRKWIVKK